MIISILSIAGLEKYTAKEVKELVSKEYEIKDNIVEFSTDSYEDIARFTYLTRTAEKVILKLDECEFSKLNDINFKVALPIKKSFKTFRAKVRRIGEHDFSSNDAEREIGDIVWNNLKLDVDLENPDIIFYSYIIGKKAYLGIDLTGFNLAKREYKIFNNPFSIKGNLAFCSLMFLDFRPGQRLLDPELKSGEFVIEAASYSLGRSIHYYQKDFFFKRFEEFRDIKLEKFDSENEVKEIYGFSEDQRFISGSKKNAKIAGVNRSISFSRTELDWLDTKFEKLSVDKVITTLTKMRDVRLFEKIKKEFFHQMDYILKGELVVLTKTPEEFNDKGFRIIDRIDLPSHDNKTLLKFKKVT